MENGNRDLLAEFAAEYFGKLFYFCLKKTGDSYEAEDLAADIALNIVAALRRGTMPENFPAWVWRIARNRYSAWAGRRRNQRESDSGADISELELADADTDIEGAWLHSEELGLLRRELSFIAADYRNVLVSYYIDDKSVGEIADMLGLPAGTVKSKLFRGREMLKEGMEMAREFGTMSYRPEQVGFSCCCDSFGRFGEPWNYLNSMLCKNILLAAYRTPSTAEELAVELGVALPYMEDELHRLTKATLMKQRGKKYETNFFILSARAQEKIYSHLRGLAPELARAVEEALEYKVKCLNENGIRWHEGYQAYEDMKWTLLMRETDSVERDAAAYAETAGSNIRQNGFTQRPDGGAWDIIGYEDYEGDIPKFVGEHGGCNALADERAKELVKRGIWFSQYRFAYGNIQSQTRDWLSYEEVDTLAKLAQGESTGLSEAVLKSLEESGYVVQGEKGYRPTFLVSVRRGEESFKEAQENSQLHLGAGNGEEGLTETQEQECRRPRIGRDGEWLTETQEQEYRRLRDKARDIALRQYRFSRETVLHEFLAFLREDSHQVAVAVSQTFQLRGAVLEEALREGYLSYDGTEPRRMLGVSMSLG